MSKAVEVNIANRWPVKVPAHRVTVPWDRWEKERLESMHENTGIGSVVFDIGSEEGDMSALYAIWGAIVVPFEPDPYVWPNFKFTWEVNGLRIPPAYFVGFAANETNLRPPETEAAFLLPERNGWPGCAYGSVITNHGFRNETERGHDTPKIRIDDFIATKGIKPDVITMDVEGAEFEVIKGAELALKRLKPLVYLSLHPEFILDKYDYKPAAVHMFMWNLGYMGTLLDTDHEHHWFYWPKERKVKL